MSYMREWISLISWKIDYLEYIVNLIILFDYPIEFFEMMMITRVE